MTDTHQWGYWQCACGERNKGNTGKVETCMTCKAPRKTGYIPPPATDPIVTDPDEVAFITGPPRWQCPSCKSWISPREDYCPVCSHPEIYDGSGQSLITSSPFALTSQSGKVVTKPKAPSPTVLGGNYHPMLSSEGLSGQRNHFPKTNYPVGPRELVITLGIVGFVILIGLGAYFIFHKLSFRGEEVVTVSHVSWNRNIRIEVHRWIPHDNITGFPAGSRNQSQKWERIGSHQEPRCCRTQYYTVDVPDGETCTNTQIDNGNGGFTNRRNCVPRTRREQRSRQVTYQVTVDDYGYRYYFETQDWVFSRNITTSSNDWQPYWETEFTLATDEEPEKEASRSETYNLKFNFAEDHTHHWSGDDENAWRSFREGARIKYNGFYRVVELQPLNHSN